MPHRYRLSKFARRMAACTAFSWSTLFAGCATARPARARGRLRLAFGEAPGALTAVAVMSDSDNTRTRCKAWYGTVQWE